MFLTEQADSTPSALLHNLKHNKIPRTTLGIPLVRDGVTVGVIGLMRSVVKPFSSKQVELVETFAHQGVIAIENVRLCEKVQGRTGELFAPSRGIVAKRAELFASVEPASEIEALKAQLPPTPIRHPFAIA